MCPELRFRSDDFGTAVTPSLTLPTGKFGNECSVLDPISGRRMTRLNNQSAPGLFLVMRTEYSMRNLRQPDDKTEPINALVILVML